MVENITDIKLMFTVILWSREIKIEMSHAMKQGALLHIKTIGHVFIQLQGWLFHPKNREPW